MKTIRQLNHSFFTLRFRMIAFFLLFLVTVVTGFLFILLITGSFRADIRETKRLFKNELNHIQQDITNDYGKLSRQGISLAENLSQRLEQEMLSYGIQASELDRHPDLLEPLLDSQIEHLMSSIRSAKASAAFLILDATVNPSLKEANLSRSGIFLKCTEPNIMNSLETSIRYLRGPAEIARSHGVELLPQWKMEFDVTQEDFYHTTLNNARNSTLPLSRLYYWSKRTLLVDNSESGMLLTIPLMDSYGYVYGVCGFEVSSMLFKLAYSPDNSIYARSFTTLAPLTNQVMAIDNGLVAGNYYMTNYLVLDTLSVEESGYLNHYLLPSGFTYCGLHEAITLYPTDSVYAENTWVVSILMPDEDLTAAMRTHNLKYGMLLGSLLLVSLLLALIISQRCINPVVHTLHQLTNPSNQSGITKTNILEIDDLIEFLGSKDTMVQEMHDQAGRKVQGENSSTEKSTAIANRREGRAVQEYVPSDSALQSNGSVQAPNLAHYQQFVQNIATLSKAEMAVFHLYMEGYSAKEITEILCLSINTIKTHNKRIYMKLNVSSRKELMVYVNMMKNNQ